ncbi:cold shock domain-containing protein [Ruegeria sp. EL01]|jgi:CspA family cold shock protein|uniref:cold shock domain-containing protein n=1 Tax=Ruegeria sp. EL01 TaxID=2107578 RepID=UPI000EA8122B|nr:cold shock domain-containing protein [Ruegeria sp. EL01]
MDGSTIGSDVQGYISGTLKWFSPDRGYGFVVCNTTGREALLHQNAVYDFGQNSIAAGCSVDATTCITPKGLQIVEVLSLNSTPPAKRTSDIVVDPKPEISSSFEPARVKWFSLEKRYGFVNVFDDKRDCFLHANILEDAGLGSVVVGEALGVELRERSNGRVVVAVKSWI